jgi:serine/threonine protein kinase
MSSLPQQDTPLEPPSSDVGTDTDRRRNMIAAARRQAEDAYELDDTMSLAAIRHEVREDWSIPDYERVRLCGKGAYGTVWVVRDRVGVHRALKVIDLNMLRAADIRCREYSALEAYCRLVPRHPNLIQIAHVGVMDELLYYTMELADDEHTGMPVIHELPDNYKPLTLRRLMKRDELGTDTAVEVVVRLLRGLTRLHRQGLAHRDIKPANIVFVGRTPKIADIGLITTNTANPSHIGTPAYMPPDGRMDPSADTYAMGRLLFELLAPGENHDRFPRIPDKALTSGGDDWDMSGVARVIMRACAADESSRYLDAEQMLDDLESHRSLHSLLQTNTDTAAYRHARKYPAYIPPLVAFINALPWILGLTLAIIIAAKFF